MLPADAERFGVHDGQVVDLEAEGPRGGILRNTAIRVTAQSQLECHLDMEGGKCFRSGRNFRGTYPLLNYIGSLRLKMAGL